MSRKFVTLFITLFMVCFVSSVASAAIDKAHLRWLRDKPKIDSLIVIGNHHFSDGDIIKRMYSRKHSIWTAIKGERRAKVQRETLARDTMEVKYLYLTTGFLDIQVHESMELLLPDSTALIRVTVDEGQRFYYGAMDISGNYDSKFGANLQKTTSILKQGKPINLFELERVAFDMKTILANDGFPYARVVYTFGTTTNNETPIHWQVTADELVRFGSMSITGVDQYADNTARRELKIETGAVYRRKDILDSQRRLFESGYFSSIQLQQSKESIDRLNPDFSLRVRERKPHYFTLKTGAGQSEYKDLIWDFSGGFGKRNLFGSRRAEFLADYSLSSGDNVFTIKDYSLITHRYRLRFTEPWFLGFRMPVSLTGVWEPELKDPVLDYSITRWSISASTRKKFGEKVRTVLGLEYESVELLGISDELKEEIKDVEGISVRRDLYFRFIRDSRDNLFIPHRGVVAKLDAEYYGGFLGGDDNFWKAEVSFSRYEKMWPGWISATRIMGGIVESFDGSSEVPINDRLYLGGANSVRGFRENSLGPLSIDSIFVGDDLISVDSIPLGANFTVVFNQEFRWKTLQVLQVIPVIKDFFRNLPLWQSVFVDVGSGFKSSSGFDFNHLAISYGTGFQLVSPAGPIRLDYARRVKTDLFEVADRWHFTILYAF